MRTGRKESESKIIKQFKRLMMNILKPANPKPRPPKIKTDTLRARLTPMSAKKIDDWINQVKPKLKGTKITRSEIVNWWFECAANELTDANLRQLTEKFFDPVKVLSWATAKAKKEAKDGAPIHLFTFLNENVFEKKKRTKKKDKTDPNAPSRKVLVPDEK